MQYTSFYNTMNENFKINESRRAQFKKDVQKFCEYLIKKGYVDSFSARETTTDYKLEDWSEKFSDKFINEFDAYLNTMNKQGDRDL